MTWQFAVDRDKSQMLTLYILRAAKKVHEKHVSRERLVTQLQKIRSLKIDKRLEAHVDELERRINEVVGAESRIKALQAREDLFHRNLIDKINRLDAKLHGFLAHHREREERMRQIERKVYLTLSADQKIANLKGQIAGLEALYVQLEKSETAGPSQLQALKERLDALKTKLAELETRAKEESEHPVELEEPTIEHLPPREFEHEEEDMGPAPPPPPPF